jgi:3'(2'), 5'-bisphosphate nucleotidase
VKEHPKVVLVKTGSIGLKVAKVLEKEADIFIHLSGKLKTWDTAGPAAIALGANLDVGRLEQDGLPFDITNVKQECSVIMGRPGALEWSRTYLQPDKVHCENGANN